MLQLPALEILPALPTDEDGFCWLEVNIQNSQINSLTIH
jgi:hypothetical protein